ncbi:hypothetical protein LX81_00357 [Palleronia aestuarii]|uniref:Uncharacterized protein n=1 Tax=Palleronia aestuarii TaxID=568105 RepID=A0A2W7NKB2_9RHOB|nr:hypothetical protein [Palleronia aestuarii]PZX19893.1 hypothetical protein LX81_00357 [Palleronia aestuarii]
MFRLLKFIVFLLLVGFLGLVGFAYLGDLDPARTEREIPVTLDAN